MFDVAHNPAGAWALRSALSERYDDRPLIFVFGAMRDKAISEMTEILFPLARAGDCHAAGESAVGVAGRDSGRQGAAPGPRLSRWPTLGRLWSGLATAAGPEAVMVVTGSIYLVGEAMRLLGAASLSAVTHARSFYPRMEVCRK